MDSSEAHLSGNHIVTVAGHIGSGKTEVCRKLSEITGWEVVSAGAILRKMAIEHGMSVLEFNEYAKLHSSIDRNIDNYIAGLAKHGTSLIVDSRLAWHFLPGSVKVFLVVDPMIAAQRVFRATRPDECHVSVESAASDNADRHRLERQRFIDLYSLNCDDWGNYDIVLDTTRASPEEASDLLMTRIGSRGQQADKPECWLAPQRLLLTGVSFSGAACSGSNPEMDGAAEDTEIEIAVNGGEHVVLCGHDRVSAAIRAGRNLIRCRLAHFESEIVSNPLPMAN